MNNTEKRKKNGKGADLELVNSLVLAKRKTDQAAIEKAFRKIVVEYHSSLFGVVLGYVKDRGEAEDVLQDVFIKVFKKIETFRGDSLFFTWLYRIASNTAADFLDKKKRRPKTLFGDQNHRSRGPALENTLSFDNRVGRESPNPFKEANSKETISLVRRAMECLLDPFKTTLFLREIQGLSYQEIAETMECSIGTVESRLFRARKKFKEIYLDFLGS